MTTIYNKVFNKSNTKEYAVKGYKYPLEWNDTAGIGFLRSDGYDYGTGYWENYKNLSESEFGIKLTQLRVDFVKKNLHTIPLLCDVGIGSGQFVEAMDCFGTDVNPLAVEWLKEHNRYASSVVKFSELTLWDVLEHIEDPTSLLSVADTVFISTPVYKDVKDCLQSKHLKPGEHIWYFTDKGVKHFMELLEYEVIDESSFETDLGRESILSYCFRYQNIG